MSLSGRVNCCLAILAGLLFQRGLSFVSSAAGTAAFLSKPCPGTAVDGPSTLRRRRWLCATPSGPSSSSAPGPYRRRRNPAAAGRRLKKPRLGLLTFDLDGTLFPAGAVAQHADRRMVEHMIAEGYATTVEDYLAAARAVRSQWEADRPGQALSYTELRRRAVGAELRRAAGDPRLPVDDLVEACCAVREHERHAAAEYYLPPGVVETLHAVKKHFGGNVCIGAVTNGGGDPLKMPSLAPFFSFCVSGEDPEVFPHRKPHPGIFRRALHRYRTEHYAPSQEAARDEEEGDGGGPDGGEEDFLWCHVGDCLANDVGASADCGAFSVWCAPDPQAAAASVLLGLAAEQGGGGGEPSPAPSLPGTGPPAAEGGRGPGGRDPRQQPGWSEAAQDELERRSELAHRAQDKISAHIYGIPQLLDVLKRVARPDRHAKLQRRRR